MDDNTFVSDNLTAGDNTVGEEGFYVWYNGSVTVMGMYSPDGTLYDCWVNNTGGWMSE